MSESKLSISQIELKEFASWRFDRGVLYLRSSNGGASYLPIPQRDITVLESWGEVTPTDGSIFTTQLALGYAQRHRGSTLGSKHPIKPWAWRGKAFKSFTYYKYLPIAEQTTHAGYAWEDRERIEEAKSSMSDWGASVRLDHERLTHPAGLIPTGEDIARSIANHRYLEAGETFARDTYSDDLPSNSSNPFRSHSKPKRSKRQSAGGERISSVRTADRQVFARFAGDIAKRKDPLSSKERERLQSCILAQLDYHRTQSRTMPEEKISSMLSTPFSSLKVRKMRKARKVGNRG